MLTLQFIIHDGWFINVESKQTIANVSLAEGKK